MDPKTDAHLQELLSNAYILGGAPCSGKSTLAQMLAERRGLAYYQVDDHQEEHLQRARPQTQPVMCEYRRRDWNNIWMRPAEALLSDLLAFDTERFPFILQDLAGHEADGSLLVEGAAVWPKFLDGFPLARSHVIFMVPTPEFQTAHYQQRPWIRPILEACTDPRQAFEHWMKRDELFGAAVASQAATRGFTTIWVGGDTSVDQLYGQICIQFGFTDE